MTTAADLWEATGPALEDQLPGLTFRLCNIENGIHMVVIDGPSHVVQAVLDPVTGDVKCPSLIRMAFRSLAEGYQDLNKPNWPTFALVEATPVTPSPEVADSAEAFMFLGEVIRLEDHKHQGPENVHPGGQPGEGHEPEESRAQREGQEAQEADFRRIGTEMGEMVAVKNRAYGNAFNEGGIILRVLYPHGVAPDQYDDLLAVVRILDKLKRIATDRDALGESPFRDIVGYGILGTQRVEAERRKG